MTTGPVRSPWIYTRGNRTDGCRSSTLFSSKFGDNDPRPSHLGWRPDTAWGSAVRRRLPSARLPLLRSRLSPSVGFHRRSRDVGSDPARPPFAASISSNNSADTFFTRFGVVPSAAGESGRSPVSGMIDLTTRFHRPSSVGVGSGHPLPPPGPVQAWKHGSLPFESTRTRRSQRTDEP